MKTIDPYFSLKIDLIFVMIAIKQYTRGIMHRIHMFMDLAAIYGQLSETQQILDIRNDLEMKSGIMLVSSSLHNANN